jgi:hypothetical protein
MIHAEIGIQKIEAGEMENPASKTQPAQVIA